MTKTSTKVMLGLMGFASAGMLLATAVQAGPGGDRMMPRERPAFAELDTNGDGEISTEEFEAFRASKFAAADTNGDGVLSADELTAQRETQRAAMAEQRTQRMIERLDTDGDGAVSPDEMAAAGPKRDKGSMIERMDKDGNGTISAEEYAAVPQRMMKRDAQKGDGHRGCEAPSAGGKMHEKRCN